MRNVLVGADFRLRTPRGRLATTRRLDPPGRDSAGRGDAAGLLEQEDAMITAALIFAALAALLHVYIFTMESLTWTSPRTRATFGTTAEEAETTKLLAFNQGFYNLFLAIVSGIGIAAIAVGHNAVGAALIFAGVGSMAAAAIVLLLSAPGKARAASTQGTFPVIAIALLTLGLIS
jgi:putative membrane protein